MYEKRYPAIEAEGLRKRFGATEAVRGLNLTVAAGTIYGLLGANGAGKTTTVRILATLLRPDGGRATVLGHDVVREAAAVRRRIALAGQAATVDEDLTGRENLLFLGRLCGLSRSGARARAAGLLEAFDLAGAGGKQVKAYSGGMVTAERGLLTGHPAAGQIAWVMLSAAALLAVFAPLTGYLYTRRA